MGARFVDDNAGDAGVIASDRHRRRAALTRAGSGRYCLRSVRASVPRDSTTFHHSALAIASQTSGNGAMRDIGTFTKNDYARAGDNRCFHYFHCYKSVRLI